MEAQLLQRQGDHASGHAGGRGGTAERAKQGTASRLERIVRAYRKAQRVDELDQANRIHEARYLQWHHDDNASFVLHGRLTPDQGAVVRSLGRSCGNR